jgi:phage terminase large subunit-like protein
LYELDEADDWKDESTWIKALPMIGVTPSREYVRRYRDDAIATPGLSGEFQVKMCNRWLHSASTWLSMTAWDRCADPSIRFEDFAGERAFIGVDLAERDDVAAVALAFQRDDLIVVFVRGYLPELVIHERARAVPQYLAWLEAGELLPTSGNLTDYAVIEADLRADCDVFDVADIVIERYGALNLAAICSPPGYRRASKIRTRRCSRRRRRWKPGFARARCGIRAVRFAVADQQRVRRAPADGSLLPTKDAATSPNKIDAVDAIVLALSALIQASTTPVVEPRIWLLEA